MPTNLSLSALAHICGGAVYGSSDPLISCVASAEKAGANAITFAVDSRRAAALLGTAANAVIAREVDIALTGIECGIVHPDPYFAYAKIAQAFAPRARANPGIHPSAVVEPSAQVDPTAEIGPLVYIAPQVRISAGVRVHAGARIGRSASVGEGTELFPNVVMYPATHLGARCIVHAGVVIGADGFGFAPHQGTWEKIPQTGGVRIGDDVEIGANTAIDRGAMDDTVIGDGVKMDNQIQIGHNCNIGDHTVIAGCVGVAGSTIIGKRCMIGGAAMISGHIKIADGVVISGGTFVSDDISESGRYTGVFPTVAHRAWLKMAARVRKLSKA